MDLLDACWSASLFSLLDLLSGRIQSGRPSGRWTDCAPAAWGRTSRIHRPWLKNKWPNSPNSCVQCFTIWLRFRPKHRLTVSVIFVKQKQTHAFSWSPPLCPRSALNLPLFCRTMLSPVLPATTRTRHKAEALHWSHMCNFLSIYVKSGSSVLLTLTLLLFFLFWRVSAAVAARVEGTEIVWQKMDHFERVSATASD